MKKISKMITSEAFDQKFDNGESIVEFLDFSKAKRSHLPSPESLLDNRKLRVTLTLDVDTLNRFKNFAKKHKGSYQRLIRKVLNVYAHEHLKGVSS